MEDAVQVELALKSYGKKTVVNRVSLRIGQGEIFGLIGPSGAGKTTLVKLLVGVERADHGTVTVLGEKMPNLPLLQRIGYMAQSDALYGELTGEENLAFFAALFKLGKEERRERIGYAADLVQLTEHLKKRVSEYSGGMKRRLSLAIALIHNPELLILDEPTVGIDPLLRLSVWEELVRLKNEGKTIVVTTHVMDEAARCDRLAMVRDGRILAAGTPDELTSRYEAGNLEEVFLTAGRQNR